MWNRILIASGIVSVFAALALSACVVGSKDFTPDIDQTNHGKIVLTTDWSQRSEGVDTPASYYVDMDGNETRRQTFTAAVNEIPGSFDPGRYRIVVWNDADGIEMNGNIASLRMSDVDRAEGASLGQSGFLDTDIGWLFSAAMDATIEADKVHRLTATMRQRVRELTLVVEPVGGAVGQIARITAMISGVAGTIDIDSGVYGTPSQVLLPFAKINHGDDAGKWTASVRLSGIADGAVPRLTGVISFVDERLADMVLESDLSGALEGFNDDMKTPLVIEGDVIRTPLGTDFRATITGWVTVDKPVIEF